MAARADEFGIFFSATPIIPNKSFYSLPVCLLITDELEELNASNFPVEFLTSARK